MIGRVRTASSTDGETRVRVLRMPRLHALIDRVNKPVEAFERDYANQCHGAGAAVTP
jgi:hypothetical protein